MPACTRSDALAPGSSYPAITLTVSVAAGTSASFINTATVSGGGEVNTANDSASDPTTLAQVPDLSILSTHSGSFTAGQTGAAYTIRVSNVQGNAATTGTVTVIDTLPAALTATAMTGSGWSCTLANLTCTRGDALAAGGTYPLITLTADVALNAPANVVNLATVSGGGEVNTANDSASDPTTIAPGVPDLTIAKTHSGNFTAGQTGAVYTILVTNAGAGPTAGTVTVNDLLPGALNPTSITGTGWSCNLNTPSVPACTRSDALAPGSSYPAITLTVSVAAGTSASFINTATVSGGGEVNTANDSASDPTTLAQVPDLSILSTHSGSFTAGQTGAAYTIRVSNVQGNAATTGTVTVIDTLPAALTATAMTGSGWSCTLANLTCTRGDALAAGGTYPLITLTADVALNAPAIVVNVATVSGGGEVNTVNDTFSDPTTIAPGVPDLTIAKTHSGNFTAGRAGVYSITVTNAGNAPTAGVVTAVDTLPAGLTALSMFGPGWNCTLSSLTCTRSNVLAAGGSYPPVTVIVKVASNAPASLTNTATVSGGGEVNAADDTATDPTTIIPVPDLSIVKTHVGNLFRGQRGAIYNIEVSNVGSAPTAGRATVIDILPPGLSAVALSGIGWNCTLAIRSCTRNDALAPGASYPAITFTVNVALIAVSPLRNTAIVLDAGDTNPLNNVSTDTAVIP